MLKYIIRKLHHLCYMVSIAICFLPLYPTLYYYSRKHNLRAMNRIRKMFSFGSAFLSGIFFKFRFEKPIDWSKPYIICPNHTSNLDITSMVLLMKNDFVFFGKAELLDNIVTRLYFKTIDIPVKRESNISAFRAFKRAEDYLKRGTSVVIFPEGLIADAYPPVLQPFKNGPFRMAIEQKINIIPVTIRNNWKIMWDDGSKYGTRPGTCDIRVHKPIETSHLSLDDADHLRDQVYAIIHQELNEYQAIENMQIVQEKIHLN